MTVSYPSVRPLIYDRHGNVKACVLVHHRDGLQIDGELTPAADDATLRENSDFRQLDASLGAARKNAAGNLSDANPQALAVRAWQLDLDTDPYRVRLWCEPTPLSHWVASRTVFATLEEQQRVDHVRHHPYGIDALYATHLGYTSTVVTADGYLACMRRTAKLLADGHHDSAIGDTALVSDITGDAWDLRTAVGTAGHKFLGIDAADFASLTPAMVAVRTDDAGLWVSAHSHLTLDREQLLDAIRERSQFPDPNRCTFLRWDATTAGAAEQLGTWTSWGVADLASATSIDFGPDLQQWFYPSLP